MPVRALATILHADLDSFYASVEQLLDPSLRGLPVAVGEGIVLAASYEAKAFGVRTPMPAWKARQLCPELRFVGGHFREYQRLGDAVMDVLGDFTPLVERISIDEAFLDLAGTEHLFGAPGEAAAKIRRRVREEIGLPLSIGVARTKHLAKVASQVAKPDGLAVVDPEREQEFLDPLPVDLIWGVGPATQARLRILGISTIGDLRATPTGLVQRLVGHLPGEKLASLAANDDPRRIERTARASSIGAQWAFGRREGTPALLRTALAYLADRVAGRMRSASRAGRTVTVKVRFRGLRSVTRAITLPIPLSTTLALTDVANELATAALADHPSEREVTLLAISVSHLVDAAALQLELTLGADNDRRLAGSAAGSSLWAVDRAVDSIRSRFGSGAIQYAAALNSELRRVPEEFRELAQRGS